MQNTSFFTSVDLSANGDSLRDAGTIEKDKFKVKFDFGIFIFLINLHG